MTDTLNPYESPASVSVSPKGTSLRRLQSVAWLIVLGAAITTGTLVAIASLRPDDPPENRRDAFVFFVGVAFIFGIAGSYLTCRYIAGNVPLYFILVSLGLFVVTTLVGGGPNYTAALTLASLIVAVSLAASLATGLLFRRMLR